MERLTKRRQNRIRALKLLSLAAALAASVWFLQRFVLRYVDSNLERIRGFYLEDEDSLDVVLIGASEVYSDFASCYAYEKFGYTSYPFATTGNIAPSYLTQLKTVIGRQHPKLVVIEVNGMLYGEDADYEEIGRFRKYADNIPHDEDWEALVRDYTAHVLGDPDADLREYRFPLLRYHSVWKDPHGGILWLLSAMQDERRGYNCLKGVKTNAGTYTTEKKIYNNHLTQEQRQKREALNGTGERYLRELLEYCRSENLDNVVFVRFPHLLTKTKLPYLYRSNTVGDLVAEYGYEYRNFDLEFEKIGLDTGTDFYNRDHLNLYGQKKFTEYFGRCIREQYGVPAGSLTAAQEEEWDTGVRYYRAFCNYTENLYERKVPIDVGENIWSMLRMRKYLNK